MKAASPQQGDQASLPPEASVWLDRFFFYLRHERKLAKLTQEAYCRDVSQYLVRLGD